MKKCHQLVLLALCLLCAFSMQMIHETAATAAEHVFDNLTVNGPVYLPETDSLRVFLSKRKEFAAENFFDAIGII